MTTKQVFKLLFSLVSLELSWEIPSFYHAYLLIGYHLLSFSYHRQQILSHWSDNLLERNLTLCQSILLALETELKTQAACLYVGDGQNSEYFLEAEIICDKLEPKLELKLEPLIKMMLNVCMYVIFCIVFYAFTVYTLT